MAAPRRNFPIGASDTLSHSRYFVGKPNIALTLQRVIEAVHCRRRQYTAGVIAGAHFLLYSKDPEADRAFFKTVLEFPSTDLGDGWLLFALPPAELALHPSDTEFVQMHAEHPMLGAVLYLMCDDLRSVIARLKNKGVVCASPVEAEWGISTSLRLPSGGKIGLYQPTHPTMIEMHST
jgi:predicted enzyme related to lactoylglutathione lyase